MQTFQTRTIAISLFVLATFFNDSTRVQAAKIVMPGQALVQAARHRQLAQVTRILQTHPDVVNTQSEERSKGIESHYSEWTALHWAVENDDRKMVEVLLDYKANPNLKTEYGPRPLERVKSREVAAKLIDAGADVNGIGQFGQMPLHVAKSAAIAEILIERGASIEARDQSNDTPLHRATDHAHTAVALTLIEHGAPIDCKGSQDETPLFGACASGNTLLVRRLIELGADVHTKNTHGDTSLWTCAGGHFREHETFDTGHCEVIKLLVARGAVLRSPRTDGVTLLHLAASRRFIETARYLLDSGLDVNARDDQQMTPLHYLMDKLRFDYSVFDDGSREIAMTELLLAKGANVNALANVEVAYEDKKLTPYQLLNADPYAGTTAEGITIQLAGYPGEVEALMRKQEAIKHTRRKIAAILLQHNQN